MGGGLPFYTNIPGTADGTTAYFSGANNGLGTKGMCVRTGDLPSGAGLFEATAANCPVPCNPTWEDSDKLAVCGEGRVCCQTVELEAEDCVQDEDGTWRPAVGTDIRGGRTDWKPARHETHQDPNGQGCGTFANGVTDFEDPDSDFSQCLDQLTVADQRGFCMALQPTEVCPTDVEGYLNACELINLGQLAPPVAGV